MLFKLNKELAVSETIQSVFSSGFLKLTGSKLQGPTVSRSDNIIQWINHYPVDK